MKNVLYIILFEDNTMIPIRIKPRKEDYRPNTRFFEIGDDKNLAWLSDWYAKGNNLREFKEIKL